MSITIKNLTKVFGEQKAVDDASFHIGEGEIVGFLGPNGAGKSTTMKIATGFLPPTAGTAEVAGYDVSENSLEVRRRVGYLPEHNPLYTDMYVWEYLEFAAGLHGMKKSGRKERIGEIISLCGLTREQNKKISALSKGYRQRVGLAQSLLHDPEVLILDEPTTGLDPNQIVEIRELIRSVSADKTVILSTHIMQEVQAICNRAIIINRGKIVADDKVENLLKRSQLRIVAEFENETGIGVLESVAGVMAIEKSADRTFIIHADTDVRSALMRKASENNLPLIGLRLEDSNLEQVFQQLTQKGEGDA